MNITQNQARRHGSKGNAQYTFIRDDATKEVMFCTPASIGLEKLRAVAQRYSDMENRDITATYYFSKNEFRLSHSDAKLLQGDGYRFLYTVFAKPTKLAANAAAASSNSKTTKVNEGVPPRVPRPRNKWILYRRHMSQKILAERPGLLAAQISQMVSKMWREEISEVKEYWAQKAKEEDRQHKRRYPNYKYTTKKSNPNRTSKSETEDTAIGDDGRFSTRASVPDQSGSLMTSCRLSSVF